MNIEVLYLKSVLKCSTWVNTLNNFPRLARNVCVSQGVCVCGGRWFEQLSGGTWDRERETAECGGREGGREDALMSYQPPLPLPPPNQSTPPPSLLFFSIDFVVSFSVSVPSTDMFVMGDHLLPHIGQCCVYMCAVYKCTHTHTAWKLKILLISSKHVFQCIFQISTYGDIWISLDRKGMNKSNEQLKLWDKSNQVPQLCI